MRPRRLFSRDSIKVKGFIGGMIRGLSKGYITTTLVNRHGKGLSLDTLLGPVGAVVGGRFFKALGAPGVTGFKLSSHLVAVFGAVALLRKDRSGCLNDGARVLRRCRGWTLLGMPQRDRNTATD